METNETTDPTNEPGDKRNTLTQKETIILVKLLEIWNLQERLNMGPAELSCEISDHLGFLVTETNLKTQMRQLGFLAAPEQKAGIVISTPDDLYRAMVAMQEESQKNTKDFIAGHFKLLGELVGECKKADSQTFELIADSIEKMSNRYSDLVDKFVYLQGRVDVLILAAVPDELPQPGKTQTTEITNGGEEIPTGEPSL